METPVIVGETDGRFCLYMPRYQYACHDCAREFEAHCARDEVSAFRPPCPGCGGNTDVHRVYTPVASVFKISGFYHVDSGKRFESQLSERGREIWNRKKQKLGVT